eukprot:scaffold176286_cov24-Prasinocladus_malaysianus.AAC.1
MANSPLQTRRSCAVRAAEKDYGYEQLFHYEPPEDGSSYAATIETSETGSFGIAFELGKGMRVLPACT